MKKLTISTMIICGLFSSLLLTKPITAEDSQTQTLQIKTTELTTQASVLHETSNDEKLNNLKTTESITEITEDTEKTNSDIATITRNIETEKARIAKEKAEAKAQAEKEAQEKAEKEAQERAEAEAKAQAEKEAQAQAQAEKEAQEAQAEAQAEAQEASKSTVTSTTVATSSSIPSGAKLSASSGVFQGPSGKETYYNLDMSGVVRNAQNLGISGNYWVRSDGVKMYGSYVIVAANLSVHSRGSLVATSLGTGIVLDTGGFASGNPTQLDIATSW